MLKSGWKSVPTTSGHLELACACSRCSRGERCSEEKLTNDVEGYDAHEEERFLYRDVFEDQALKSMRFGPRLRGKPTALLFASVSGLATTGAIFFHWPFPHTVPVFLGLLCGLAVWTAIESLTLAAYFLLPGLQKGRAPWSFLHRSFYLSAVLILLLFASLGLSPPSIPMPVIHRADPAVPEKYLIAAALYNSEAIYPVWSEQVIKLTQHCESSSSPVVNTILTILLMPVGVENVVVSVVESYSNDATPALLQEDFVRRLNTASIKHRITTGFATWKAKSSEPSVPVSATGLYRTWPYSVSPERVA